MKQLTSNDENNSDVLEINFSGKRLSDAIKEVEGLYFSYVMTRAQGNKAKAARLAGMCDDTFRKKIRNYEIKAVYVVA